MQVSPTDLRYKVNGGPTATGSNFVPGDTIAKIAHAHGVAFTSRYLLEQLLKEIDKYGEHLFFSLDGTHKIHDKGWVLMLLGVNGLRIDQGSTTRSFCPRALMLAKSESAAAVSFLFSSLERTCGTVLQRRLEPEVRPLRPLSMLPP